jgi:hypothetical protein
MVAEYVHERAATRLWHGIGQSLLQETPLPTEVQTTPPLLQITNYNIRMPFVSWLLETVMYVFVFLPTYVVV